MAKKERHFFEKSDPALYAAASDDHGTPAKLVDLARRVLGGFDLDPFSSSYWNHWTVRAERFYDEASDGFAQQWYGRMLINPPGNVRGEGTGKDGNNVRRAWEKLVIGYRSQQIDSCFWIGFSLEQLTYLQNAPMHPLQFATGVPVERQEFLTRGIGNGPPVPGTSPRYGNYVTLLPTRRSPVTARDQMRAFVDGMNQIGGIGGAVVRPW